MAKGYWLMKTEPGSFGITDLERVKVEPWTGVRNYQARNYMRDGMRIGDDVLFYHSNAEPSGVAGLARVHRTGVVDQTQFDPKSQYYDERSTPDAPRWIMVEVSFVARFSELVTLDELRHAPGLEDMLVIRRGMRLSVQPVTAGEYAIVAQLGRGKPRGMAKAATGSRAAARQP